MNTVKKKSIAYITVNDPHNQQIRSGVPHSIYEQLTKYYNVVWIKPQVSGFKAFLLDSIAKIFEYIIRAFGYESIHNPLRSKARAIYTQKELNSIQYDALFCVNTEEFAYLNTNRPIFYRNDAIIHSMIDYYYYGVPHFIRKWAYQLENKALAKVKMFFAPSQWILDEAEIWKLPIDKRIFHLVESGANLKKEEISYPLREYAKGKPLNMLFVGYDVKRKGIDVAYETLCILTNTFHLQASLTVVGGKPDTDILSNPQVTYIGKLNKNNPKEYERFYDEFAKANLFIFPTKAECHGIVNCEAAAYGLPIYSYDTGGVSTYVRDGVNGRTMSLTAIGEDFAKIIFEDLNNGNLIHFSLESRKLFDELFNWDVWGEKVKTDIDCFIY